MALIQLVRKPGIEISEEDKAAARRVLFGIIDGVGEKGQKQWRRLFNSWMRMEPGEMSTVTTNQERLGDFHKKHMKIEQVVFAHQDRFDNFDTFRDWLKIGAGFVEWCPGPKGAVVPVPKSISYATLDQIDMEEVHTNMMAFLRGQHAQKLFWPHLSEQARMEMMETILTRFNE